jgi:xanthine dehydrogenase YagT iron-sulfur-binding subunit
MSEHRTPTEGGLSRRAFLRGSGVAAAATALTGAPPAPPEAAAAQAKAPDTPAFGPAAVPLELTVNGTKVKTTVEPRVTLLDALRNYIDVTGPKRVCDRGTCGACTCHLDGKPVYSCMTLALEAQGRKVETAEGLIQGGTLHPVPAAFGEHDAQQCGFCTPGFVMAMKAVFDKNPKPTPAEVEAGLAGNICRCGTYQQMREAARALCEAKKGA